MDGVAKEGRPKFNSQPGRASWLAVRDLTNYAHLAHTINGGHANTYKKKDEPEVARIMMLKSLKLERFVNAMPLKHLSICGPN